MFKFDARSGRGENEKHSTHAIRAIRANREGECNDITKEAGIARIARIAWVDKIENEAGPSIIDLANTIKSLIRKAETADAVRQILVAHADDIDRIQTDLTEVEAIPGHPNREMIRIYAALGHQIRSLADQRLATLKGKRP